MTDQKDMVAAMGLIHPGYGTQVYRQIHSDPAFRVVPPVSDMLTGELTLLPPLPAQEQADRAKKVLVSAISSS